MKGLALEHSLAELLYSELVRAALDSEQSYLFKHALVQDTAYQSLLKNERRAFHRAAAHALQSCYPDALDENAARLAEHYWHAEEWERAADFSQRAGTHALRVFAMREAMQQFERAQAALEKISDAPREKRIDAILGWADASAKYRPYAERLKALQDAEQLARVMEDKRRLAQLLYRIGSIHNLQGHNLRALLPLTECFTLIQELGDERYAVMPTYFMGMATLDPDPRAAVGLYDRAIELAECFQDDDMQAVSWSAKAWALARLGEFANARAASMRAQALLERVKSPMIASDVDLFTGWAYFEAGDAARGLEFGRRGLSKAHAADNMDCVCGAYLCVGFNQLMAQHTRDATDTFREAIRQSQYAGADAFENLGQMGLAVASYYTEKRDTLADLEKTYARARAMDDVMSMALIAEAMCEMLVERGEMERAEILLNETLQFYRRNQMIPSLVRTLHTLSNVYAAQGRTVQTQAARAEIQEYQNSLARAAENDVPAGAAL